MWEVNRDLFYTVCLIFGLFWVIIEGLIAYWIYKLYKIVKTKVEKQ